MGIGKGLKTLRKNNNMTMEELATTLNDKFPKYMRLTKGKISKWENEKEEPRLSTAKLIAEYFGVQINDLYDESPISGNDLTIDISTIYNQLTPPRQKVVLATAEDQLQEQQNENVTSINNHKKKIAVKCIHAGAAGVIGENLYDDLIEEDIYFYEDEVPKDIDFCVLVNGDSMEPMMKNGSYAFIKKQENIKDGTIALVLLDGAGFIKRVDISDDYIKLISLNQKYEDITISSFNDIRVIGKVVL